MSHAKLEHSAPSNDSSKISIAPKGYAKKPRRIYVLSLILVLYPLFSFVNTLKSVGVETWYSPSTWVEFSSRLTSTHWWLVALTLAAGVAVLFVNKKTLLFSTFCIFTIFAFQFVANNTIAPLGLLIPALLLASSFRIPYFDAEKRWWTQFPRFFVNDAKINAIIGLRAHPLQLINISLSGALLDTKNKIRTPSLGERLVLNFNKELPLSATVLRVNDSQIGVKFDKLSRSQKRTLKNYIEENKTT